MKASELLERYADGERDFRGASLGVADLYRANLPDVNLSGANLTGANIRYVYLKGANLDGANLERTSLDGANVTGTILDKTNKEGKVKSVKTDEYSFHGEIDIERVCREQEEDGSLGFILVGPVDCILFYRDDTTSVWEDSTVKHSKRDGFLMNGRDPVNTGVFSAITVFREERLGEWTNKLKSHVEEFKNRPKFRVISAK